MKLPENVDFSKSPDGLVPAVVQDARNGQILMLGYMNEEALQATATTGKAVFFSRSKNRLWRKGETSGNELAVTEIRTDCDRDTLLIQAVPAGPTCHTGAVSCFQTPAGSGTLHRLESDIQARIAQADAQSSYTARLVAEGMARVAQKVGEEGVEVVIEAMKGDKEKLAQESADLLYHLIVLLNANGLSLSDVEAVLEGRRK